MRDNQELSAVCFGPPTSGKDKETMSKELALVILLSCSCFDKCSIRRIEHLLKSGVDWFQVFNLAVQRQTAYLAYSALKKMHYLHLLPRTLHAFWAVSYDGNIKRNKRLIEEKTQLVTELQKREIPAYPIKGIALLENVYKDIGVRYLSDIDFLVPPQYCTAVCKTIKQLQLEALYINDVDPYLYRRNVQDCHSLFCTRNLANPQDIDFCCDFNFTFFDSEEHPHFFHYIIEHLDTLASAPAFHAAHILLLCINYYQTMEGSGFPTALESENLIKLIDIHTYISHYWGDEVQCEFEKASGRFHLDHIISYTMDSIKRFQTEDIAFWIS